MKKIIVFNVAAESGGALTILNKYYEEAFNKKEEEWHFIISTPELESKNNVHIHNYPWVKKSWLHRLLFDIFFAHKIVDKYNGELVLSLQNILVPFVKTKQIVYFHQVLPFSEKKFGVFENTLFWIYQKIISKIIIYSIKNADEVIVQANWIKKMFVRDYKLEPKKILVQPPKLEITTDKKFETALVNNKIQYFYPASFATYKNHELIINVVRQLVSENFEHFNILFTLTGKESREIRKIKKIIEQENLPITFVGYLSKNDVYDLYTKSILLFPSYLESYPMPLEEAKIHNTEIIVSNLEYAKEILSSYDKVTYFNPFIQKNLYEILKEKKVDYYE